MGNMKKLQLNHVLLSIIGGLLIWIGTQVQRSFGKSDGAHEIAHRIEMAFLKKTYSMDSISVANKNEVIDSLEVIKDLFGMRTYKVDSVYDNIIVPTLRQVNRNSGRISILEEKVDRIEREKDLTLFENSGLK